MSDDPNDIWDGGPQDASDGEDLGRFWIDDTGESYVDAHVSPDFNPEDADFRDMFGAMGIDPDDEFLLDQITIHGTDAYDPEDIDARGPYDRDEVVNFMNDTGWWGISDIFYDDESDEYYVDINYDDGAAQK